MKFGISFVVFLVVLLLSGIYLRKKRVSWMPSRFILLLFGIWIVLTTVLVWMGGWVEVS